jgi:predicted RNase H-like HicB family nuclease
MKLTIETERETDGRWIAEVMEIPGVIVYGSTIDEAIAKARIAKRTGLRPEDL